MLSKSFTFFMVVIMAFSGVLITQAQERSVLKKNRRVSSEPIKQSLVTKKDVNEVSVKHSSSQVLNIKPKGEGLIDTLSYRKTLGGDWTNGADGFGQSAQDVMIQWYKAPADLYVRAVGIGTATNENDQPAAVKIVKLINYTDAELAALNNTVQLGYFPGEGDGFNGIAPFENDATGPATGDWVSIDDHPVPFEYPELWSDDGFGFPLVPEPKPYANNEYDWIEMSALGEGSEPTVLRDEIFGIVVSNTGNSPANPDGDRQSFWSQAGATGQTYPLLKFYEYTRTADADGYGWWIRPLALDFVAIVEIFGDEAPQFVEITNLPTTLSTEAREVEATITDRNPGGGDAGVASVTLKYSINGGGFTDVAMTLTDGDALNGTWSGNIPGQTPGTVVNYYIEAVDVGSNANQSATFEYRIFQATPGVNTLIVFNGYSDVIGYPPQYYFGSGDWPNSFATLTFDHDAWAYGSLTEDLVNNYTNILEITAAGPVVLNSSVIRAWLEGDGSRNYLLAGDEWLGAQTGYNDTTYVAGDFHFDILGINADYNDINFAAAGDQLLPSVVYPQEGTLLGGPIYDLYTQVTADSGWSADMAYDPDYEISVDNWLDGVDFEEDVEVDMQALAIDGETVYNIAGHRTLPAGNKIAFFAYDPLSLNSDPSDEYFWYGFMDRAPQVQVLEWFGYTVGVEQVKGATPTSFKISQNYPNPFNPATTIDFAVPKSSHVTLKVYDILGKEVTTLINNEMNSGNYKYKFDASGLASGMYIYTLSAGDFSSSKKMVLLK